ncbi:hypothetical protein NPIL_533771 [Nephila pilipes]|uniref:Uncharacterized protein n=1 Tax=Nephila pilipes TaxID=299642 RepID=A0A8X6PHH4_NEPPI|nr:hypothetical protein NPIL_533771 [Nephila pilipes]
MGAFFVSDYVNNKLLSDELKYYFQQILEYVWQQPTTILPPPSQVRNNNNKKKERNLVSPTLANKESKKFKHEANSEVSDNDSETMHSLSSSSRSEIENEISVKEATPLPASEHSVDRHQSGLKGKDGFTVVSRKERVPPVFIDESLNTPKFLKELSEKTGSKVLGGFVKGKLSFLKTPKKHRITSLSRN